MEKKYTLWQRIVSVTPLFFKRAQLLGITLAGLGSSLLSVTGFSEKIATTFITIGTTITVIAQFAVKQYEPVTPPNNDDAK